MRHSLPSFLLAALLLASAAACAAEAPPAVDNFFRSPSTVEVELSPKGGYAAIINNLPDGTQALVIRSSADPLHGTGVTSTTDQQRIAAIHWINENRIGFTVKDLRVEFDGNWDEFAVDRDGSHMVHLISGNWQHRQESTGSMMKSHILTADYAFHSVTHDGSDDILVDKYSWNNIDRAPEHARVYRLNTRTRELTGVMEGAQPAASLNWLIDGDDQPRVVTSQLKGECATYYRKAGASDWAELEKGLCYKSFRFTPLVFSGSDTLYVRAGYRGYGALFRYDLKTMQMDKEPFITIPGFDYLGSAEIDATSRQVVGFHLQADAGTTVWLNPVLKAEQARIDAALPGTTNTVHCAADCLAAPVLLVKSESDRNPARYILYTRASGAMVELGQSYPDIKPAQMGLRDFHHFKARDGRDIPAYVTMPPGKASAPLPAVVLVHGGPSVRGGYWAWEPEAQFLASRGYVVIQPEYRGGTGFGGAHFQAGWKQWGGTMQDDLADAAHWAVKQGWADPKRIAIMGGSYGGYATLMGLIKNPETFRCGVEWAGVTDINLMFNTPQSDASEDALNYSMRTLIGDPDKDAALFSQNSPLLRAAELKQPLLMAHGAQDRRVPIEHASRFRDAVKNTNPNLISIIYNDEAHGWRHDNNRIDFWRQVETFLDKNLKAAP